MPQYFVRVQEKLGNMLDQFCITNKIKFACLGLGWVGKHKGTYLYKLEINRESLTALTLTMPGLSITEVNNERKH